MSTSRNIPEEADAKGKERILLTAGGKCLANVVLPDEPNVIERFAGEELVRYLERMSARPAAAAPAPCRIDGRGVPPEVLASRDAVRLRSPQARSRGRKRPPPGNAPTIRFIRRATGKPLWYPATDAFTVTVEDGEVRLAGSSRALLYAVYHLLERFGARFFIAGADDEALPAAGRLALPADYAAREEAEFAFRAVELEWLVKRDWPLVRDHIDWMAKNRFNILPTHPDAYGYDLFATDTIRFKDLEPLVVPEMEKRGIALNVGVHTTWHFLPPSKYLPEHSDWYACKSFSIERPAADEAGRSWCAAPTRRRRGRELRDLDFLLSNLKLYFEEPIDVQPYMGTLGANNISPAERLAGLSPDGTMSVPTQMHYTNPDAIRAYCENILAYLREHPYVGIIGVWPVDLNHYCACEKCAANPGAIVDASLYVARRVAEEFSDVLVEHLLYTGTTTLLPDETVRLPGNFVVTASGREGHKWAARCTRDGTPGVYQLIYTLADNFSSAGHQCISPSRAIDSMQFLRANSMSGYAVFYIDMLSYWRSCQNLAMLSKLSWRRDLPMEEYLDDFCARYFLGAGGPVREIYRKLLGMDEKVLFEESSEADADRYGRRFGECRKLLAGARGRSAPADRAILDPRLNKLAVYVEHLAMHAEATRWRTRARACAAENRPRDAALAVHRMAIALEAIKSMCLESFLRGDGVLDWRLTLILRKLVSFPENRRLVESILGGLREKRRPGRAGSAKRGRAATRRPG